MDPPPPPPPPSPPNSPPPVNWDALDALVLYFARSDCLVVPPHDASSPPSSPSSSSTTTATSNSSPSPGTSSSSSSSSYRSRQLIRRARRALEAGDVDTALRLLRAHAPAALGDLRLLFHLHKQRFVELVRRGTEKDREEALDWLRTQLAPCALDAYPEAYEEFKHIMLVLIYDKDDQSSPVVNEWSVMRRMELAGLLSSILRAHLQAYDPILSMTLRYLISIHKAFCSRQGISSPISDLTERLLLEDRDPPVVPRECSLEAPPFGEVDVQALANAVELTRQGAVDSLKFSKGDLYQAFQNELCRMKLDQSLLDKLVHEYCMYRGIVEGGSHVVPGTVDLKCSENNDDSSVNKQGAHSETQVDCEMTNNHNGDCSTSDITRDDSWSRRLRRVRSSTSGQRTRKRWRGRVDDLDFACERPDANKHHVSSPICDTDADTVTGKQDLVAKSDLSDTRNMQDQKYEVILEMNELARKGMASKVVEEINSIDPDFFSQNPILLFQLKQIEFLNLVAAGDHVTALKVASTHLGPLAANNPALLKSLKETLVTLIQSNEDVLTNVVSLPVLASSLQAAMSRRLGIEEPQLMKIVRTTIHTHSEWFKLQMCKDRFEQFLKIDSLKEIDPSVKTRSMSKAVTDECGNGSSQITTCSSGKVPDEGGSPQDSSEVGCDENAILKVMEFLAMPRADAIQLLMQYSGDPEAVIQQIFQ